MIVCLGQSGYIPFTGSGASFRAFLLASHLLGGQDATAALSSLEGSAVWKAEPKSAARYGSPCGGDSFLPSLIAQSPPAQPAVFYALLSLLSLSHLLFLKVV